MYMKNLLLISIQGLAHKILSTWKMWPNYTTFTKLLPSSALFLLKPHHTVFTHPPQRTNKDKNIFKRKKKKRKRTKRNQKIQSYKMKTKFGWLNLVNRKLFRMINQTLYLLESDWSLSLKNSSSFLERSLKIFTGSNEEYRNKPNSLLHLECDPTNFDRKVCNFID